MIDYRKPEPVRIDYTHKRRPRTVVLPDADGVVRLRAGESVVLR